MFNFTPLYKIIFNDNDVYYGGNLQESLWNKIPKKPIKKLEYNLFSELLILENYQSYNHLIEKSRVGKQEEISRIFIMGKRGNLIDQYILSLNDRSIMKRQIEFGKEYNNMKSTGWKQGIKTTLFK